jgi:SDR family mycofactocin-dependent oxidoreductase
VGKLDGKVAVITGGGRGQGRAIAVRFAREGARVVVSDIAAPIDTVPYELAGPDDLHLTENLVKEAGGECLAVVADVRYQDQLDEMVSRTIERFGGVDILVSQAGIVDFKPFWEISEVEWDDEVNVNLTGHWRAAKAVAPHMMQQGSGSMIFTSSVAGVEAGWDYMHYVAAKHGVLGLMKSAALELGPYGIRCNAVIPGPVDTLMNDNPATRSWITGIPGASREDFLRAVPHWFALRGRTALPIRAIEDAMTWLASEESECITGLELRVDAGHTLLPGLNPKQVVDESLIQEQLPRGQ